MRIIVAMSNIKINVFIILSTLLLLGFTPCTINASGKEDIVADKSEVEPSYQGQLVSDLIDSSNSVSYDSFFQPDYVSISPVMIEGIVCCIVDSDEQEILLVKDEDGHFYYLYYSNVGDASPNQAIVPNFAPGDKIKAYGYFMKTAPFSVAVPSYVPLKDATVYGFRRLCFEPDFSEPQIEQIASEEYPLMLLIDELKSQESQFFYKKQNALPDILLSPSPFQKCSFPWISVFYAAYEDSGVDSKEAAQEAAQEVQTYEYIVRNPYSIIGTKGSLCGEVLQSYLNSKDGILSLTLKDPSDNLYLIDYELEETSTPCIPSSGDSVSLTFLYEGNAKILSSFETNGMKYYEYILYPYLKALSLVFQ